jgi:hypothetical protein
LLEVASSPIAAFPVSNFDAILLLPSMKPPRDFVGFAIEFREPGSDKFWAIRNRIGFPASGRSYRPAN